MNSDIKELLEKMAANLGTTSEFLFEKLVKQAKVNAIAGLLQLLFVIIVGVALTKYMVWQIDIGVANYSQVDNYLAVYIVLSIVDLLLCISFIFGLFNRVYFLIDEILKSWFTPEAYVIEEILDRL